MVVIEKEHTFIEIDAWCIGECENTVYEICFEIVKKKREREGNKWNKFGKVLIVETGQTYEGS